MSTARTISLAASTIIMCSMAISNMPAQAAYNNRGQCYDGVTSSCNNYSEPRRSACLKNGYKQCDGQFKAPGASSGSHNAAATRRQIRR